MMALELMKNTNAPSMASTAAPDEKRPHGVGEKLIHGFGLILHEDAFGYRFIGRTGLYLVLKKQTFGLLALSLTLSHGERELGCRA